VDAARQPQSGLPHAAGLAYQHEAEAEEVREQAFENQGICYIGHHELVQAQHGAPSVLVLCPHKILRPTELLVRIGVRHSTSRLCNRSQWVSDVLHVAQPAVHVQHKVVEVDALLAHAVLQRVVEDILQ